MEISCVEDYAVDASYEGVQTDGDCSANPLDTTASSRNSVETAIRDWQMAS